MRPVYPEGCAPRLFGGPALRRTPADVSAPVGRYERPSRPSVVESSSDSITASEIACRVVVLCVLASWLVSAAAAQTASDMLHTKHNLSVSGPGPIRALTETRICIFCHTPHNAAPLSPLWNKEIRPQVYTVYTSPTLKAGPLPQPAGPTKLCLSCHDGTIAMGAVLNPRGGITMVGGQTLSTDSLANFGLNLSGHHPVSFPYHSALPNPELATSPPADLVYGGTDEIHCTTCHDPHNDTYGKFLLRDNRFSALCTDCHQIPGWTSSAHATSAASVVGILPRPPKTWPTYPQLNEWGCEVCHTPHFAPTAEELLNFTSEPPAFSCTSAGCHTSEPPPIHSANALTVATRFGAVASAGGTADIARQTRKISAHHELPSTIPMAPRRSREAALSGVRAVACSDCHNPHLVSGSHAEPPYASGMLRGVSGIDRDGAEVQAARYEYEVCFKCHSDYTTDLSFIPRVITLTNTRLAFDPSNPSYHPVVSMGKTLNVPSIPSSFEPNMTASALISCTSCHADDEGGSKGPHGSSFRPILKERYETADNTPESYDHYALCYRCHDRSNILRDASFQKRLMRTTASGGGHSGHLMAGVPCSACHDPHGINDAIAACATTTGTHTHLINFDTRIVSPKPSNPYPVFTDTGTFAGRCSVCCHNVLHDDSVCSSTGALKIGAALPSTAKTTNTSTGAACLPVTANACTYSRVVCGSYP
jgi:predicted CXXCH cytochrome family protein